ncbi:zinc metalloprotease HtpX [Candidatus Woesearchaeota archaeon]|nr:zinc metalloprotease HtpX [Candidatus Woesearchaeota archaeon]
MSKLYHQISVNKWKSYFLIFFFMVLVSVLGLVFGFVWGDPYVGLGLALIIAVVWTLIAYFTGSKQILALSNAKEITREDDLELTNIVEGLSIAAGMPKPKVYLINDPSINAFATGRNPETSAIAVTTGARRLLNKRELEGVISHEMSHIKNYDIRLMTLAVVLVGIVALLSHFFLRSLWFSGNRRNKDSGNLGLILMLIGVVLAILSPFIAQLIKLSISRKREYLADASGALLTRNPKGLINALKKIQNQNKPVKYATPATALLYISNPLKKGWFNNLFSTHPPLAERIKKLESY